MDEAFAESIDGVVAASFDLRTAQVFESRCQLEPAGRAREEIDRLAQICLA
jgi:hypothetical protein